MAIEMAGAVYCPLNPLDPPERLQTLIKQTQTHLVLVHKMTNYKLLADDIVTLDIDGVINVDRIGVNYCIDFDRLEKVPVTADSIAFVIFTSGSTGVPKAVSLLL